MERRINGATKKWYTEKHCGDGTVLNIVVVVTVICLVKVKVLVAQSCLTLCDCMDYILPGFSAYAILQARTPEWVAIPFSRRSS